MQQIAATLPAEAAAPAANMVSGNASASSGAFSALLLGASTPGQGAGVRNVATTTGVGVPAAMPMGRPGEAAEDKGGPAAAITAAVMETIERQQQAVNAMHRAAKGAVPGGDAATANGDAAAADGTAKPGMPGKGLGLVDAPGRAGATPADGAPPPGQAGATPGKIMQAAASAAAQDAKGNPAGTVPMQAADRAGGAPAATPTTDAHAASAAQAAIKAGALQTPAADKAATQTPAPAAENTAPRAEPRPPETPRPAPVTANAEPPPPSAVDPLPRGGGTGQPAGAQTAEGQTAPQTTTASASATATAGADPAQAGTASQPRPVMAAQPMVEQVAVHIQRAAAEGLDRIMIHLNPPQLGRVDVKLEFGHDGRIQAIISADNPDALDTLRQDARALERALADAGVKSDPGSLSFQLRGEGRGGDDETAGRQNGAPGADPDDADLPEEAAMAQPDEWHDGMVDIRV